MQEFHETFQAEILNVIIQSKDFLLTVKEILQSTHFGFQVYQDIYSKVLHYYETFDEIPTKSLLIQSFEDAPTPSYRVGKDQVLEVIINLYQNKLSEAHILSVRKKVFGFIKHEKFKEALSLGYEDWQEYKYEDILTRFQGVFELTDLEKEDPGSFLFEAVQERIFQRENPNSEDILGIPTGYSLFDSISRFGGVPLKRLCLVVAGPGVGKSILLTNLGASAAKAGFQVLHFTLENTKEEAEDRYDALISTTDVNKLFLHGDKVKKAYEKMPETGMVVIKDYPSGMASIRTLETHMKSLERQYGFNPQLIIIDYADEMWIPKGPFAETRAIWTFRDPHFICIVYNY